MGYKNRNKGGKYVITTDKQIDSDIFRPLITMNVGNPDKDFENWEEVEKDMKERGYTDIEIKVESILQDCSKQGCKVEVVGLCEVPNLEGKFIHYHISNPKIKINKRCVIFTKEGEVLITTPPRRM